MPKKVRRVSDVDADTYLSLCLDRFFEKVKFDASGCWLFSSVGVRGYGRFAVGPRDACKHYQAHKWLIEVTSGRSIPKGLESDHLCRVHNCVNLEHLELVTHEVNVQRGLVRERHHRGPIKSHCKQGHPFDKENTYQGARRRACRACTRAQQKRYQHRLKEKAINA